MLTTYFDIIDAPKTLLREVLMLYGEAHDCPSCFVSEFGLMPPVTRQEAVAAIDSLQRAKAAGYWPWEIWCEREVIRDIVLVRRGVNLLEHFTESERVKGILWTCPCGDGDCEGCDQCGEDCCHVLGVNLRRVDLTCEITRVALEY